MGAKSVMAPCLPGEGLYEKHARSEFEAKVLTIHELPNLGQNCYGIVGALLLRVG